MATNKAGMKKRQNEQSFKEEKETEKDRKRQTNRGEDRKKQKQTEGVENKREIQSKLTTWWSEGFFFQATCLLTYFGKIWDL